MGRSAEELVGITVVVLGLYVLGLLFKGDYAPRSRFALLARLAAWLHWKAKAHWHSDKIAEPTIPNWNYGGKSVFVIGIVHGLGAETPSQLLIFFLAPNFVGLGKGFLCLSMFLSGLLPIN